MSESTLSYHLYTLFLFTKSDLKTVVLPVVSGASILGPSRLNCWQHGLVSLPQTLFAVAAAPSCSLSRIPHAFLWFWAHALQFGLANQSIPYAFAEDAINHPYRPLPAGRVSVQTARTLRWITIPLCLLLSAAYGPRTMLASFLGSLYMLAYNEGGGARGHWLIRNLLNAGGHSVAEVGTMLVACMSLSFCLGSTG
jgi:UbiA prenyltransferase family